jgi:HK97 gp10 family phage protein
VRIEGGDRMSIGIIFDTKGFDAALKKITIDVPTLQKFEQKGASVLIDGMKQRAAVDTGEMRDSIKSHITEASLEKIEDEVGPEVKYAVYQEYGTGIYAENSNGRQTPWVYRRKDGSFVTTRGNRPHPFVRPTAINDKEKTLHAIEAEFKRYILTKWN